MDKPARAVIAVAASLQLTACMLPLSADFGLNKTNDYITAETLEKISNERLTKLQVQSLLGDPTGTTADGKAMGYVQCASWPVK
jgi:hypothetical protein